MSDSTKNQRRVPPRETQPTGGATTRSGLCRSGLRTWWVALAAIGPGALFGLGAPSAWAQGSLIPPGAPEPAMKSLQEIWNRIGGVERQVTDLKDANAALGAGMSLLLDNAGIALPWQIRTVDSAGSVGSNNSPAFTPGGQPAIGCWDSTNFDLTYAVRAPLTGP